MAYMALMVFWPYREGKRFILPVLPFMYFYMFTAAEAVSEKISKKAFPAAAYVLITVLFASHAPVFFMMNRPYDNLPRPFKNFISMHEWIKNSSLPRGVIFSRKPAITYYYTNRQAVVYPFTLDAGEFKKTITENGVRYIIAEEFSLQGREYLMPFIYGNKDKFRLLHNIEGTLLLEIKQPI